jgi:hypothetical protein
MVTAAPLRARQDEASQVGVLTLFGLPNTGYHLKKAITVEVERDEGGSFVISEANTGAFHYDQDLSRALAGFVGAFVEEFEFLVHHQSSLSPALSSDLDRFRILVEPSAE